MGGRGEGKGRCRDEWGRGKEKEEWGRGRRKDEKGGDIYRRM